MKIKKIKNKKSSLMCVKDMKIKTVSLYHHLPFKVTRNFFKRCRAENVARHTLPPGTLQPDEQTDHTCASIVRESSRAQTKTGRWGCRGVSYGLSKATGFRVRRESGKRGEKVGLPHETSVLVGAGKLEPVSHVNILRRLWLAGRPSTCTYI